MKAFPRMSHTDCFGYKHPVEDGMDLRDYFAAKALQSFLTIDPARWNEMYPDADAMVINAPRLAYAFADVMMKVRGQ